MVSPVVRACPAVRRVSGQDIHPATHSAAGVNRNFSKGMPSPAIAPVKKFVIFALFFTSGIRMDEGLLMVRRLHRIPAEIDRNAIDPGGEFCFWFVPFGRPPYPEEDLLGHVLGLRPIPEGTVDQIQDVLLMALHQARKSKLLSKNLFRLQGMADRGKQKDGVLRPFHQGRSNRAAPAIVSAMSYILEIRPAAT